MIVRFRITDEIFDAGFEMSEDGKNLCVYNKENPNIRGEYSSLWQLFMALEDANSEKSEGYIQEDIELKTLLFAKKFIEKSGMTLEEIDKRLSILEEDAIDSKYRRKIIK